MKSLSKDQNGLVSIVIAVIIITVVTLVVLGFSGLVRREQRQALDQQLSAQARYAAESAINRRIAEFRDNPSAFLAAAAAATGCLPGDTGPSFAGTGSDEIRTTCVRVDSAPGPLEYDDVTTSNSRILWLDPDGANLRRLVISWQNPAVIPDNDCLATPYTNLPNALGGNDIGMLRFDLSRVGPATPGTFTRDSLKTNHFSGLLYPRSGGTEGSNFIVSPADQPLIFGTCDAAPPAGITEPLHKAHAVINIAAADQNHRFILRLRGVYKGSQVKVVGFDDSNNIVHFADVQVVIEATARVNDVVQRIQVRVPSGAPPPDLTPDSAVHVTNGGLCKLLQTEPGSSSVTAC